jgi:hypothetical protein
MSEEQREHPRIDERKRVSITVLAAPDAPNLEGNTFFCWTRDISAGGLKFCVHSRVPVGARLKLQISLAGTAATFQHIGRVMWLQEFEEASLVSNWLGIKIMETLGGPEKATAWNDMIARMTTAP